MALDIDGNAIGGPAPAGLAPLVERLAGEHRRIAGDRLEEIQSAVERAADAAPDVLLPLTHKVLALRADLRRLFDREEHGVFPMLARLETVRVISKCHAGMVRSRARFAVLEQKPVEAAIAELRSLAGQLAADHAAGAAVLPLIDGLIAEFQAHVASEREELFPKAVALEDALCARAEEGA